jgi:peptidyl-prolyl cis-trans isomerase D
MIQFIRSKTGSIFVKAFLAILVLGFVGTFGLQDLFRSNPRRDPIAKIGPDRITVVEAMAHLQKTVNRFASFGLKLNKEQIVRMGLADNALNALIDEKLYALEADRLDLSVSEDLVKQDIFKMISREKDADPSKLREMLKRAGLSERQFIKDIETKLYQDILTSPYGLDRPAPKDMASLALRHQDQKRTAAYVEIKSADRPLPKATTETYKQYYDTHPDKFMSRIQRQFAYVIMDDKLVADQVSIAEKDLLTIYEDRKDTDYYLPESRTVLLIEGQSKDDVEAAFGEFIEAESFKGDQKIKELQAKYPKLTIKKDNLEKSALSENDTKLKAFTDMSEGDVSPISEKKGRFSMMQLLRIKAPSVQPFTDIKEALTKEVTDTQTQEALSKLSDKIEDTLAGGASLMDVASEYKLTLQKPNAMDRNGYHDADQKQKSKLDKDIIAMAFDLEIDKVSSVEALKDGKRYIIMEVIKSIPAAVRPFDDVSAKAKELWAKDTRKDLANKLAQKITKDIGDSGQSLRAVAQANGLVAMLSEPFKRTASSKDFLTRNIVQKIFKSNDTNTVYTDTHRDGVTVAQLVDIKESEPKESGVDKKAKTMSRDLKQDLEDQYKNALKQRYTVTIKSGGLKGAMGL